MRSIKPLLNKRNLRNTVLGIVFLTAFTGIMLLQAAVTATAPPGGPPKEELENDTNPPDPLSVPIIDPVVIQSGRTTCLAPNYAGIRS